jgi:hypothetical protein
MLVAIAPDVHQPTADQVRMTRDAATRLRSRVREWSRAKAGLDHPAPTTAQPDPDPEIQRLLEMLQEWRHAGQARRVRNAVEFEQELQSAIERTLAWAEQHSK